MPHPPRPARRLVPKRCLLALAAGYNLLILSCADRGAVSPRVEVFAMSKCAFGAQATREIVEASQHLGGKVDLVLQYIGEGTNQESFSTMYGPDDVIGDKAQLCARDLGDEAKYLRFLECHAAKPEQVASTWARCAVSGGLDRGAMTACMDGSRGETLLRQSFAVSKRERFTGSPTVRINGMLYEGPRRADAYADAVCAAYPGQKPVECAAIVHPRPLPITVVADRRCKDAACDPEIFVGAAPHLFPGAVVTVIDWQDPRARGLLVRTGLQHLPVALFGNELTRGEFDQEALKRAGLTPTPDGQGFALSLGTNWDPNRSI